MCSPAEVNYIGSVARLNFENIAQFGDLGDIFSQIDFLLHKNVINWAIFVFF